MMVMPGNNSGVMVGYLSGRYEGRIGWLISPGNWKKPFSFIPYAIDNGAFTGFKEEQFLALLDNVRRHIKPIWILVPDKVGDKAETLRLWDEWEPRLRPMKIPLAMAMQDGMTPEDFKGDLAFIGGSTRWKWRNLSIWKGMRFHVGRVNTERHLWQAHELGAESCDGTGWFRNASERVPALIRYLEQSEPNKPRQTNQIFLQGINLNQEKWKQV